MPMTQIVENWAEIIGLLIGIVPAPDHPGFAEMHIRIEAVRPVDGFPALIQSGPGEMLVVFARDGQVAGPNCPSGTPVAVKVRAAGPPPLRYYAHPDWSLPGAE